MILYFMVAPVSTSIVENTETFLEMAEVENKNMLHAKDIGAPAFAALINRSIVRLTRRDYTMEYPTEGRYNLKIGPASSVRTKEMKRSAP